VSESKRAGSAPTTSIFLLSDEFCENANAAPKKRVKSKLVMFCVVNKVKNKRLNGDFLLFD
jgi:hypothetical protein